MRFLFRVAAVAALALLTACSARADIGAPPTPPPIPTAQPQVIVISQPAAPQPQAVGVDVILVILIVMALTAGAIVAALITYVMGLRDGRQSASAQPQPYSQASGRYLVNMDAREFAEFQALQNYKAQQLTQGRRDIEVRR